jgi:uncharacterized protein (TIGR00251 family)
VSPLTIQQKGHRATFRVRVVPRASRTELAGIMDGALRIRLTAPPVEGAANEALVRFLAKRLGVARYQVEIVAGASGRDKTIAIDDLTAAEVARRLLSG